MFICNKESFSIFYKKKIHLNKYFKVVYINFFERGVFFGHTDMPSFSFPLIWRMNSFFFPIDKAGVGAGQVINWRNIINKGLILHLMGQAT